MSPLAQTYRRVQARAQRLPTSEWSLPISADLVEFTVCDDAMAPALLEGEPVLVDRQVCTVRGDGRYVLDLQGHPAMRRVQVMLDGSLTIIPDNPVYAREKLPPQRRQQLRVLGRVVWPR